MGAGSSTTSAWSSAPWDASVRLCAPARTHGSSSCPASWASASTASSSRPKLSAWKSHGSKFGESFFTTFIANPVHPSTPGRIAVELPSSKAVAGPSAPHWCLSFIGGCATGIPSCGSPHCPQQWSSSFPSKSRKRSPNLITFQVYDMALIVYLWCKSVCLNYYVL